MEKVRYGIIGAGGMARGHLGCIAEIPDIEIVAVADPDEPNLARFRELNDSASTRYLRDYHELLSLAEIEAVVFITNTWILSIISEITWCR